MRTIGKILIALSFFIFAYGVYSFKSDFDNEQRDLIAATNDENAMFPETVEKMYKNHYVLDGFIVRFGAVSLIVGGLLMRKSG